MRANKCEAGRDLTCAIEVNLPGIFPRIVLRFTNSEGRVGNRRRSPTLKR